METVKDLVPEIKEKVRDEKRKEAKESLERLIKDVNRKKKIAKIAEDRLNKALKMTIDELIEDAPHKALWDWGRQQYGRWYDTKNYSIIKSPKT